MAEPVTYSGRYNLWQGPTAFSTTQITSSNPKAATAAIPMHDSGTPFLWHFIDVEQDGKVGVMVGKEVERQKTQSRGVVKVVGKAVDTMISIDFNISDVSLKNICQVAQVNPNAMTDGLTDGGIAIEPMSGLDITALAGRPFLLTHEEYGYDVSGGEKYPKIGANADPHAILIYLGTNVKAVDLGGQPPQTLLSVTIEGSTVSDATRTKPLAGYVELDLTAYVKES